MKPWKLTCMLCGHVDSTLTDIQGHMMDAHGYSEHDLQSVTQCTVKDGSMVFTFHDGTDGIRCEEE